jgi:excisionase family DNA binding protein
VTGEPLFTPKEAAATLKVSMKVLMEHVRSGRIRFIDVGAGKVRRCRRFTAKNIATFIEKQKVRETPCQSSNAPALKHTASTFKFEAVGFLAIPKPETKKTLKLSNAS